MVQLWWDNRKGAMMARSREECSELQSGKLLECRWAQLTASTRVQWRVSPKAHWKALHWGNGMVERMDSLMAIELEQ